jgi:hypothetical protein
MKTQTTQSSIHRVHVLPPGHLSSSYPRQDASPGTLLVKHNRRFLPAIFAAACLALAVAQAAPAGTAFTYQARLTNDTSLASGPHDLEFRLFDDLTAGVQVGPTLTMDDVQVSTGVFTVALDFGSVFDGNRRWLSVAVRPGESVEPYTTLAPRQELTATPHALFARRAESADGFHLPFNGSVSSATTLLSIDNTGTGTAISGVAPSTAVSGSAIAATGVTQGGSFRSSSTSGRGVYGWAIATAGLTSGVHGQSDSSRGRGVFGDATATTSAANYGGWFQSSGTKGMGAFGWASSPTGVTYGVYGMSDGDSGRGVQGMATSTSGVNYGLYGRSDSVDGRGAYGFAANPVGQTYGGYFETASEAGFGVFGMATAASGYRTYGVFGQSKSTVGEGVHGFAEALTGETRGVVGRSMSTSGQGVTGLAEAGSGQTYGGYFESRSKEGTGVYAIADFGRPAVVADHILDVGSASRDGWLRVYGSKATEPLVSASAGSDGGMVAVSDRDAKPVAIMEANRDLSGGLVRVSRGGPNDGVVLQGDVGDGEPMVRITGSSRSAIFDMRPSMPSDETVILPQSSIHAPELGDEPGIAVGIDGSTTLSEGRITLVALDINAPEDGYVLALGTTMAKAEHDGLGTTTAHFGFYDGVTESYTSGALVRGPLPAGTYTVPVATQKVYPVHAGLNTISFIGREDDDDWTATGTMLTLIYIPTAYGAVPSGVLAGAPTTSPIETSTASAPAAKHAISSTLAYGDVERELKELKARLARLEAVLAKVEGSEQ